MVGPKLLYDLEAGLESQKVGNHRLRAIKNVNMFMAIGEIHQSYNSAIWCTKTADAKTIWS